MIVEWSKALQLSPTIYQVHNPSHACEKVASDVGLDGSFHRVLQFPRPLTSG